MRNNWWVYLGILILTVPCYETVAQTPSLGAGAIVNGASFAKASDPNGALAPGTIVSAFGANLASATQASLTVPLSNNLNGSSLTFFAGQTSYPAPLFFVSSGQINAQVPFNVPLNSNITAQVNFNGQTSTPIAVTVSSVSPGIFFSTDTGGNSIGALLHNDTFAAVTPLNPAKPGEFIDIFCTGLGAVNPTGVSGDRGPGSPPSLTTATPTVTVAGANASVPFSGLAPGFVGLYQVAFQVPAGTPAGLQKVVIIINGVSSNIVNMSVGAP